MGLQGCLINTELYEQRRVELADADGDGVSVASGDCNDEDASVFPGASEHCDGLDEDCDGVADNDPIDAVAWYVDADGDLFGSELIQPAVCDQPANSASQGGDCDDLVVSIHPDAEEHCDGIDEDCDGVADNDAIDPTSWYTDADSDGFGTDTSVLAACEQPAGTATAAGDCDDLDAAVGPDKTEICSDGIDNDCDGTDNGCGMSGAFTTDDADAFILGAEANDGIGLGLATADLDGDGYGDVLSGALHGNAAYIVSGRSLATVTYLAASEGSLVRGPTLSSTYLLAQGIGACDVDGDGWTDALLSGLDYGSASDVWVFDGPITDDRSTDDAWSQIQAQGTTDFLGTSMACGDINGDTAPDLLISAGLRNGTAGSETGAVYTILGPLDSAGVHDITDLGSTIEGDTASMHLGAYVALADVDGDGRKDRVVGATEDATGAEGGGAIYVFTDGGVATSLADADISLIGEEAGGRAGVAAAGDLDGDGLADVVMGAPDVDSLGVIDSGAAFIYRGRVSGSWPLGPTDADGIVNGLTASAYLAIGTGVTGDIDQDGTAELAVGAFNEDRGYVEAGVLYLLAGATVVAGSHTTDDAMLSVAGARDEAQVGLTVAGLNDLNADGLPDLVMGAIGDSTTGSNAGGTFIFFGSGM